MPQIALPKEFFEKERASSYSNWQEAFWRELYSNSLDPGATKVRIVIREDYIIFEDNGPGMTREVAEHVYLSVGRSSKDREGSAVGGFGRARVLTCFSMASYAILSQDYFITGSGAEYEITPAPRFLAGFSLQVWDKFHVPRMKNALRQLLAKADFASVETTVDLPDSEEFSFPPRLAFPWDSARPSDESTTPALHTAFVSDEAQQFSNLLFVRVNGMPMYEDYVPNLKGALIVELCAAQSRDLLTANRDGAKPLLSALLNPIKQLASTENPVKMNKATTEVFRFEFGSKGVRFHNQVALEKAARESGLTARELQKIRDAEPKPQPSHAGVSMSYTVQTSRPGMAAVASRWNPATGFIALNKVEKGIVTGWIAAVEGALAAAEKAFPETSFCWAPGLVFCDAVMAEYKERLDGIKVFSLNPYSLLSEDPVFWQTPGTPDFARNLLASAMHEVAHVWASSHDYEYAEALTKLIAEVNQMVCLYNINTAAKEPKL